MPEYITIPSSDAIQSNFSDHLETGSTTGDDGVHNQMALPSDELREHDRVNFSAISQLNKRKRGGSEARRFFGKQLREAKRATNEGRYPINIGSSDMSNDDDAQEQPPAIKVERNQLTSASSEVTVHIHLHNDYPSGANPTINVFVANGESCWAGPREGHEAGPRKGKGKTTDIENDCD